MNKYSLLFDAAKAYGRILASEVRVTQKDKVNTLIKHKINRSPRFFFAVIKTRREYQKVKLNELVENEIYFSDSEKTIMWDGIFESIKVSTAAVDNNNLYSDEKEVQRTGPTHIGKGGFGVVERVQLDDGSIVARKTLQLTGDQNEQKDLKRRFKREVEYQSSFNHSNIVRILGSDLDSEIPWFIMPLATCHLGMERVAFDLNTKKTAFLNVLDALEAVHNKGHVHRDIKPANVLRYDYTDGSYRYALSDFGLISPSNRSNTTNITSTQGVIGTELYMPRECYLEGFSVATAQSDIYSLGVLLLFLFKEDNESLGVPYDERKSAGEFGNIISKCTKKEPNDRYESIAQLRDEFQLVLRGEKHGA